MTTIHDTTETLDEGGEVIVDFRSSKEQAEFRAVVSDFLARHSAESAVRKNMASVAGYDPAVWRHMTEQLELPGLVIPTEFGGAGFGLVELALVMEEMGAALLCSPFFATSVLAVNVLLASDDVAAQTRLLPGIADGSTTATVAFIESGGDWRGSSISTRAAQTDGGWRIDGTKSYVIDGHTASLILVFGRTDSGIGVFAVDGDAPGLVRTPLPTLDQTRKQAVLEFREVPAQLIGAEIDGDVLFDRALDLASVALAAEQVGGAQRCLDDSVGYAKTRVQFGRPIGSFQAIKHKCADTLVLVESARTAAYYAAWAVDHGSDDLTLVAGMAKAFCSDAYFHAAADNIQIHGGIGFTWEHSAHLYFKRAKSSALMFGTSAHHRARVAQRVGI